MSNFDIAFDRLIDSEGGYSNNPVDPGKETMWGITIAVARPNGYLGEMRNMPRDIAKGIYFKEYWLRIGADMYAFAIGFQVFDAAVNHGVQQAAKLLQGAVGALPDGNIGPRTQAAIAAFSVPAVVLKFNAARLRYYEKINNPTFFAGWMNRMAKNLDYAATDLST